MNRLNECVSIHPAFVLAVILGSQFRHGDLLPATAEWFLGTTEYKDGSELELAPSANKDNSLSRYDDCGPCSHQEPTESDDKVMMHMIKGTRRVVKELRKYYRNEGTK